MIEEFKVGMKLIYGGTYETFFRGRLTAKQWNVELNHLKNTVQLDLSGSIGVIIDIDQNESDAREFAVYFEEQNVTECFSLLDMEECFFFYNNYTKIWSEVNG